MKNRIVIEFTPSLGKHDKFRQLWEAYGGSQERLGKEIVRIEAFGTPEPHWTDKIKISYDPDRIEITDELIEDAKGSGTGRFSSPTPNFDSIPRPHNRMSRHDFNDVCYSLNGHIVRSTLAGIDEVIRIKAIANHPKATHAHFFDGGHVLTGNKTAIDAIRKATEDHYSLSVSGEAHKVYGSEKAVSALANFIFQQEKENGDLHRELGTMTRDADAFAASLAEIRKEFNIPSHQTLIEGLKAHQLQKEEERTAVVFRGRNGVIGQVKGTEADASMLLDLLGSYARPIQDGTKAERERCIERMTDKLMDLHWEWLVRQQNQNARETIKDMVRRELEAK